MVIKSIYPKNWDDLSKKCRQRDRHRCVVCHDNKKIQAHHTRNDPTVETLITLCKKCHDVVFMNGTKRMMVREFNELRLNPKTKSEDIDIAHKGLQ